VIHAHHLILGGARSGKSRYAEELIRASSKHPRYVATAQALDDEMRQRIERHQQQRPSDWQVFEEPLELHRAFNDLTSEHIVLIDCLTVWLSNCLQADQWPAQKQAFLAALEESDAEVLMVSNEVGCGIVPMGQLSRHFVDEIGWLHQELATHCSDVSLITAGLATTLKKQNETRQR
jgi:adenosylcobinamide kinase/adenosylcobinamide-phosphate guanylyltransferase